jgi:putative transposase
VECRAVSFPDRLTVKGRLLRVRSGHAEVEVQRDADRRHAEGRRERRPVADLTRKHGVSKATFFKWRSKYGGATVSDVKRLRELEAENAKLKRMYADLALENAAIKDVLNRKL